MSHLQIFINSIIHPKKLAALRLLSIGKVLQYVFMLITLITLISYIQFLTGMDQTITGQEELMTYVQEIQWLVYPFVLVALFVISSFIFFIRISIFAFIGAFFLRIMKRRGEYRHIWRTTAFALTVPTILSMAFSFFPIQKLLSVTITTFVSLVYIGVAMTKYPKKPSQK